MYDVLATMDLYKDFMPWSQSSCILWHKHDDDDQILLDAKIKIGSNFLWRDISHMCN
jgi:ribosome-associated toxin RatA of RatAB toxin-antitoxin module